MSRSSTVRDKAGVASRLNNRLSIATKKAKLFNRCGVKLGTEALENIARDCANFFGFVFCKLLKQDDVFIG